MGSVFELNILSIFYIFAVFAINIARISKCCSVSGEVDVDVMMVILGGRGRGFGHLDDAGGGG